MYTIKGSMVWVFTVLGSWDSEFRVQPSRAVRVVTVMCLEIS